MRILVFSNFPPYVLGGAENQVARLTDMWLDMGHHVEVAGYGIPDIQIQRGSHKIRLHHLGVFRKAGRAGNALTFFLSLARLLLRVQAQFDIIYCRGLGDAALSICLLKALKLVHLPLISCPINAKGRGDANSIQSIPGWKYIINLISRYCDSINVIAADIKPDLKKLGITKPYISEIPNGIPVLPLNRKKNNSDIKKLIFTGRLCMQKGIDNLITALAKIHAKGYQFHCDIVGEGPLRDELQTLIYRAKLADYVSLQGAISPEQIRKKLLERDVFILPSRYEGMSNSALEALETGMPIVLTRCGGIDHFISQKHGWVCEPDDISDLCRSLCEMLDTPAYILDSMGAQSRLLIEKNFSMNSIAAQNIALMQQTISRKK